jgi:hypothetical protein
MIEAWRRDCKVATPMQRQERPGPNRIGSVGPPPPAAAVGPVGGAERRLPWMLAAASTGPARSALMLPR